MTYRLVLQPEAEADLNEAYRWYEDQRPGLGGEFIESVEAVIERIRRTPELPAVVYKEVRQALVRRFPYVVCYVFQEDQVDVVSVYHGHRDPTVWKSRADERDAGPSDDS
ncbi:MAG: type II toxin-antitoxin system RelE/ParE family toxin [Candidatus Nealsonbacteria bacterium]|nr:type II toxin-antitoxin system RelE/ParE family toxin [Candidatus Nealsonbacteria bacterium]